MNHSKKRKRMKFIACEHQRAKQLNELKNWFNIIRKINKDIEDDNKTLYHFIAIGKEAYDLLVGLV